MVQVLAHTAKEAYRFKTTESVDASSLDEVSQLGEEFAQFVTQKAFQCSMGMSQGLNSVVKKVDPQKSHPAFRKSIFDDVQMIPAMANTHICYEFDAQFKEMDAKWSKAGKKFSDEPRLGKPTHSGHNGPRRAYEYPKYNEREVKVFGTQRQERPFSTSKRYTMPHDRCTIPYKPTPDESTSHLGPGTYAFPDPWKARSGDGNVAGTAAFISEAKSRGENLSDEYNLYREEPTMIPSKVAARLAHQSLTGSPTRAKSPQDFSRAVIDTTLANRALPAGQMQNRRPQTTSGVMRGSNFGVGASSGTYSGIAAAERNFSNNGGGGGGTDNISTAGRTAGTGFRSAATGTSSKSADASKNTPAGTRAQLEHLQAMSTSLQSDPTFYKYLTEARINNVPPGSSPIKFKPQGMTRGALSRLPGLSFGNGKLGKSAVDVDTGTTGADKKFRRLKLPSGEAVIYETNKDSNASNMPLGARFTADWDQTGAYAEKDPALQVQAETMYMEEHPATRARTAHTGDQALPGPKGVLGVPRGPRSAPVVAYRIRPASASVAVALPAPQNRPKVHPGYREWRPPQTIERKFLSLSRGCTPAGIPMGDTPTLSPPPKHIKVMRDEFLETQARTPGKNIFSRTVSEPALGQDILGTLAAPWPDQPPIIVDIEKISASFDQVDDELF